MKKTFTFLLLATFLVACCCFTLTAQETSEKAPTSVLQDNQVVTPNNNGMVVMWDLQFDYEVTPSADFVSMAGGVHVGDEFWVSVWNSDSLARFDNDGNFIGSFAIPGVSGTRSMSYDGTSVWVANNSQNIYEVDPSDFTVQSTFIALVVDPVRFAAFDSSANSGMGGFWVGNFNTDLNLVDMSGNVINTIPAATHGLGGMYGAAVDNISPGGPYLWVFHQAGDPTDALISQIALSDGTFTGVGRDVEIDLGTAGDLAGGMFISTNWDDGGAMTLGGVMQASPDRLFGFELSFVPGPDINGGAISISSPTTACGLSDSETIIAKISNDGAEDITDFMLDVYVNDALEFSEMYSGTLTPGDTVDYTFNTPLDMSSTGPYFIDIFMNAAGDINNSNDRAQLFAASKAVTDAQVDEDFDTYMAGDVVFDDLYNVGQANFTANVDGTPSANTGPSGDVSGNGTYVYLEATGLDPGTEAVLTTNCIDLTNAENAELIFFHHMFGADMGTLSVQVVPDGGVPADVFSLSGPQQAASEDPWGFEEIDLSAYDGQQIEINFRGSRGVGFTSDIALDGITISFTTIVSTNEVSLGEQVISLFPNPASDLLNLQVDGESKEALQVQVFDVHGKMIVPTQLIAPYTQQYGMDISNLVPGTYHVRVFNSTGHKGMTFVKL